MASGAARLSSWPAPGTTWSVACGRSFCSRLDAFRFARSLPPHRIATGHTISLNRGVRSSDRMDRASSITSLLEMPMPSNALPGMHHEQAGCPVLRPDENQ